MSLITANWVERDRAHLWHPCTQQSDHEWLPMLAIARANGAYLFDHQGQRYIDAISSWWTCLLGHSHPKITAAVKEQLDTLDHVIFGGCTHEPAVELAEALCAASGLQRVFFADIGSAAVEVALKMSFHYFQNQHAREFPGSKHRSRKQRFVCLSGSYHGETLGALSVTDVALYRKTYGPILLEPLIVPSPDAYLAPLGTDARTFAQQCLQALEAVLSAHHDSICALILEPLVQCAGGMRMYDPHYLSGARALCDRYNVHLIADEIAVGFGRTGTLFACQQAKITPDFLLLGKGITGGSLPLAAVVTREVIYQEFYAPYQDLKAFLHSHSFTGNPLCTRAAVACMRALKAENWLARNAQTAATIKATLAPFSSHPNIAEVRQTGMIAALELVQDKASRTPFAWQERRGIRVYQHGLKHGALLRPLGNVIYWMPPFCISNADIAELASTMADGIEAAVT
jgi:adenosylmethionine---8-amino-7-oxononanoate aminotransferase